jgi:PmbA protein
MTDNNLSIKIEKALETGLKFAKKAGASHCEAYGVNEKAYNLEIEKKKPKHNLGILHGLAFRVIANDALGFAYTSSFQENDIKHTVNLAIQNAKIQEKDPDRKSFPKLKETKEKLPLDKKLYSMKPEEIAEIFEKLQLEELPKNIHFLFSFGFLGSGESFLKNSQGLDLYEKDAGYGFGIGYLSSHGFPVYDIHAEGARKLGELNPENMAKIAIDKVLESAKPKTMSVTGEYPVIMTPEGSYGAFGALFSVLTNLLRGDKASRGDTVYADKIGDQIAPENFTLIDDPLRKDLVTSTLYDGEGIPTQRTKLIEKGILQTYYLDSYYAGKLNMESNGKATRGGLFGGNPVKGPPQIGSFATIIEPGDSSVEEMISETKEGFMLKSFMGIHMSDMSSGRFAVTGSGWYIKNGEQKFPVQDISLSGTIPDLLKGIDMISKERKKGINNEVPYLRVEKLNVTAKKLDFKVRFGIKILKLLTKLGYPNPYT